MTSDRRWLWVAGVAVVVLGALAWGIPLATLLTIAALLVCPAAMFFGMGMMGRTREGGMEQTGPAIGVADGDPLLILKRRLAAGEITLDEYERLAPVIGGASAAGKAPDAVGEQVTHVAD